MIHFEFVRENCSVFIVERKNYIEFLGIDQLDLKKHLIRG